MSAQTPQEARRVTWAWLGASVAGVVLHALGLADALTDRAYVRSLGVNNDAEAIATTHVENEAVRLAVKVVWTGVGVAALLDGQPASQRVSRVLSAALVGSVVALDTAALLERSGRKKLIRRVAMKAGGKDSGG